MKIILNNLIYAIKKGIVNVILSKYYKIKIGLYNLKIFFKVVWKFRWWDFAFFYNFMFIFLDEWIKNYGKNSHFKGDCFVKKRVMLLKQILEELKNDGYNNLDLERKFWTYFGITIGHIWD